MEIILHLDKARESRAFIWPLRMDLKHHILGLEMIERMRKQSSRVKWLRLGDANTKYFHLKANGRCRKIFIRTLQTPQGLMASHYDKAEALAQYYKMILVLIHMKTKHLFRGRDVPNYQTDAGAGTRWVYRGVLQKVLAFGQERCDGCDEQILQP